jgi:hypothetical protein
MKNHSLQDYSLMCDCAESAARLGILLDFLKHSGNHFYSLKAKQEPASLEDIELLKSKYQELEGFVNSMVNITE